jgi:hypothetical protein
MSSTQNQFGKPSINEEDDDACLYAMLLSSSHIFPMVLNAAIDLNLFEIIARAGPDVYMSPSEIASQLPTQHPDAPYMLDRMLRLLASNSLLTCSMSTREDGSVERLYGVSPAGKFYVQNEDGGSMDSISSFACHRATVEVLYVYATYIATTPCMLSLMHI